MIQELKNGYVEFDSEILSKWIAQGVNFVEILDVESNEPYEYLEESAFELIPHYKEPVNSNLYYSIDSADITDLTGGISLVMFMTKFKDL